MAAGIALVNLILIIICQPWMINPPGDESFVLDPSELEFSNDERESAIPVKDTILSIGLICLFFMARRQLGMMIEETEEIKHVLEIMQKDHENVMEIKEFCQATEESFTVLQAKSKAISKRMNKAEEQNKMKIGEEKIKEDLEFVKQSWFQQFSTFTMLGIEEVTDTDVDLEAQLKGIKEKLGQELNTIEQHIDEDKLSLEDAIKDIHILQNYFGNVERNLK